MGLVYRDAVRLLRNSAAAAEKGEAAQQEAALQSLLLECEVAEWGWQDMPL